MKKANRLINGLLILGASLFLSNPSFAAKDTNTMWTTLDTASGTSVFTINLPNDGCLSIISEVNGRVIDNLLNELGIDTDFDTVKNEIIKGIKSYKLGDLDYWAIHIGHGANGNRFDIHGRVAYSSELIQLIDKDGTVTVYFDVQEQGEDDAWNFGFIADIGVKVRPVIDTNLVESLKEGINDELIATSSDGETTLYLSDERQANHGKDPHYEFTLGENGYFTRSVRCDDNRCEKVVLDWIKQFNLDISKSEISRIIKLHESNKYAKKDLKESVDGYIATDEDCNMSGKGWVLDGSYNFIMEFLQEWGIAPKDVKVKNGMTTLFNADGNPFGYVYQDEEVDIFVADKTTNWTWENHNPSTKRVKVTALDKIF